MSRLRVDLIAPPFRGHLHPILGLGRALRDIAEVRVLSTQARVPDIEASGLTGVGFLSGREAAVEAIVSPSFPIRGRPWRLWRQFHQTLDVLDDVAREIEPIWRRARPDLVIVDSVLPNIGLLAQRLGVRWWTSAVSPCAIEPRRGAPGYLGGWRHRDDLIGRIRDRAGLGVVQTFKRIVFATHRARLRAWGAASVYRADGSEVVYSPECILGLGMQELELPRRWPAAFRFLGPVLYTPPTPGIPTPVLEANRTHVLVTLGTHLAWAKAELRSTLQPFAERERQWIFHFSAGDAHSTRRGEAGEFFREYHYIPYDAWLPRFDLVLHHGGTGVMYECIKAARPALVWPVDYDQFDHAVRLERAGIGRRLRRASDLPAGLAWAREDDGLRARLAKWQAAFGRYHPEEALRALVAGVRGQSD